MSNEQSSVFLVSNQLYPNQIIPTSPGIYGTIFLSGISQNPLSKTFISGQLPSIATDWSNGNNLFSNNLIGNSFRKSSELNSFVAEAAIPPMIDPLRQNIATSLQRTQPLEQPAFNNQLTTTIALAQEKLTSFFEQPDVTNQLTLAFGQGIDADLAKSVSQKLPNIQVVADSVLGKANGAYALTSNTIFLSQSLVERGNQQEIVAVLLEEIGHSIDGYLNTQDAAGDEGEIFAKLVNGQLNNENYQEMLTEDDHNQIIWNGQVVAVENYVVSQPIYSFAIQAGGKVTTNGSSDFDGNPLNVNDDAFIYAGKGFDLNGQTILPVQRNQAGTALTNSSGQLLLVDQAVVVAPGYLISASNGSNNYTNLNPPQVIAQQTITIPSYAGIKQQELAARIPVGATTVVLNVSPSPINNANQWQQFFPAGGTPSQPKVIRVLNGSLNIPNNVDLSNYVILVENGDITLGSNNKLTNVTLVATNVYFKNNQVTNSSILAANIISGNSQISFTGKNLLATGQGNVTLNGTTTGLDSAQNLRIVSQGQITLNGSVTARGEFRSVGNFLVNGSSNIYGTIATLQDVRFNGNSTFTYANTGSNNLPPNVPTIQIQASSDTGISNSDRITVNPTPVIIGTGDVGATIKLADNGTVIGQTTVGSDGKWQITTSQLIDGNHPLTVSAINSTGIASAASAPLQVTIDTVIALPTLNLVLPSDSGTVGDYRTKAAIVNLTGKTEANANVILSGNPTPVTSDAQGDFTFTNVALNPQANSFTVTATDIAGNSKSYTQIIYRTSAPTAVNLSTPQILENSASGLLVGNLSTIDLDGVDNYVYSLVDNAGGRFKLAGNQILIDNGSLLDFEANQQHQIQVRTTDSEGDNFLQTITIQVGNVNETPTSLTLSNSTTAENVLGGSLMGNLSSTDPDVGDTSSFSLVAGTGDLDNSKFSVINRQLVINQSPNFEAQNSYSIRLRVTDAGGLTLDRAFNISVTDVNEAPLFTSQPILSVSTGQPYSYTITTVDPDTGDTRQITADRPLPSWLQLLDNGNGTATLTGTPETGDIGFFPISLTVTDAGGIKSTQEFNVGVAITLVEGTSFTKRLEIPLTIPATGGKLSFKLDSVQFDVTDTKGINDALEVSLLDAQGKSLVSTFQAGRDAFFNLTEGEAAVTGSFASYDAVTGLVTLNLTSVKPGAAKLVFKLVNDDKDVTTSVRLTDLTLSPTAPAINGTPQLADDTADAPNPIAPVFFNSAKDVSPSISSEYHRTSYDAGIKKLYANIGLKNQGSYALNGSLVLVVNHISDPSVQALNVDGYTPEGLPYYTVKTINGKLDPNQVAPEQTLVFKNPNGVQFTYDLTVLAGINAPPVIKSQPEIEVIGGQKYQYQVKAEDINGDTLTYKLLSAPDGMTINPSTGLVSWTTALDGVGNYQLAIEVSDGRGGITQQDFNLAVINTSPNRPPVFVSNPLVGAMIGDKYQYTAIAKDADNDSLVYNLRSAPTGLTIDANTGMLSWTPNGSQLGTFDVSLEVTDGRGGISEQQFKIYTGNSIGNHAPLIVSDPLRQLTKRGGRIIMANDEWPLSNRGFQLAPDTPNYASNIANWFTDGKAGNFYVYSYNYGLLDPLLATTMVANGHTWTVNTSILYDLPSLLQYDAIFLGDLYVDNYLLTEYVKAGGSVYLLAGTGNTAPNNEAGRWNSFLSNFGLAYDSVWNTALRGDNPTPVNSGHPVFKDVNSIYYSYGNGVTDLNLQDSNQKIIFTEAETGVGLFGVYADSGNYQYQVQGIDSDGDQLTYSLEKSPRGMVIDANTGLITWQNNDWDWTDKLEVVIKIQDGKGGSSTQAFQLSIEEQNQFVGKLTGSVYIDRGTLPQQGVKGEEVFLDSNKNNILDAGELVTLTDDNGKYSFIVPIGDYTVAQKTLTGLIANVPANGSYNITVASSQVISNLDFLNSVDSSILPAPAKFVSNPLLKATVSSLYQYQAIAKDNNFDPFTYDLVLKPNGMTIDSKTGTVNWRPNNEHLGQNNVIIRISDGNGETSLQSFIIDVTKPNLAPQFINTPPGYTSTVLQSVQVFPGATYNFQFNGLDPENDAVTYKIKSFNSQTGINVNTPGISIDAQTGLFTWNTVGWNLGFYSASVELSDSKGGVSSQYFTLELTNAANPSLNLPPVITSAPRTKTSAGQIYAYQVVATDANADQISYSLVDAPTGMIIDSKGLLTWNPTVAQLGQPLVKIRVSDGKGGTAVQNFGLDVVSSSNMVNHVPEITSAPAIVTNIDRSYSYQLAGKDSDNDTLFWNLDQAPDGMVLDATKGILRWNPNSSQVGNHTVVVRLTDAYGMFVVQEYNLQVNGVNTPVQIKSVPNTVAGVSSRYTYQVAASDVEGDALAYALGRRPDGMVIDSNGLVSWMPTVGQVGSQTVDILVTDAQGAVTKQTYSLVVGSTPINQAPTITSKPIFGADVNGVYQHQVVGNDPENSVLTYALAKAPVGMVINAQTGLITWNSPVIGAAQVLVKVTDGAGLASTQGYTLTTTENHAPVIISNPATQVTVGNTYRYDVVAQDVDGDTVTYALDTISQGKGMVIDQNGRVSWKPGSNNIGNHQVVVTVTDVLGKAVNQAYSLLVAVDNAAPFVSFQPSSNFANIGETIYFQINATDNVGIGSRQLVVNNQAVALDNNGIGSYTVTAVGVIMAQAIVTDANGNVSTSNTTVNVIDPTNVEAPVVNVTFPTDNITGIINIVGSVTDTNLDYYVLEVALAGIDNYKEVFRGTSNVTNGLLGKFDPSGLANDTYNLRLTAFDVNGKGIQVDQDVAVASELKLGNFRLSFTDIAIPVAGVPITLTRTYDTLTANSKDDFGYGWRMEFRDTDLRTSLKRDALYEELGYFHSVGFQDGDRVYITLPGGKREGFTFRAVQVGSKGDSGAANILNAVFKGKLWKANFDADKGNTSKLTVPLNTFNFDLNGYGASGYGGGNVDALLIRDANGKLTNLMGSVYRPDEAVFGNRYNLTTKDGTVYEINATTGDLESVKDTNGNKLTYSDTEIVSSNGQKVVFERDNQGRIVSVIDPLGVKIRYEYDAQGDLVGVIDRDGNTTRYQYNSTQQHYLDKIIDSLGREAVKTEYDAQGRLKKTANATGNGVEFIYDPANSIEVVKDALGNATTYEYDVRGNIVTEIDALGGITHRVYDDENNLLSETDAEGRITTYEYDSQKNQLSRTDGNGNIYRYTYGVHGRLTSSTDPLGNTTTYTLDGNGNPLTKTNAKGEVTTYTYDGRGNQTSETNALGQTTYSQYDGNGNLIQETDALGHIKKYTYDGRGNQLTETRNLTTATGVRTLVDNKTYDNNGNVTSWTDAAGNLTKYEYNANNKQISVIDSLGKKIISKYDDNDRLTETIFADGLSNHFTYDANGKKIQSIDRERRITTFQYDAAGRSTALISPDGTPNNPNDNPRKLIEYDKAGWLKAIVDEQGNRQEWIYDGAGNQIGSRSYSGTTPIATNSVYDAAGRRISATDPLGRIARYVYDSLGRLIETRYADGVTSKTVYDAIGNEITKIDRANHQTKYEYDALRHLIAVIDPTNSRTTYNYDELGDLIAETDANGHQTKYEYDSLQRRVAVIRPLGQRSTTTYDSVGNITSTTDFNSQTTNYTYGLGNLLVGKQFADGSQTSVTYTATGNRQSVTDSRGTTNYTYNAQGNITKVVNPDGQQISYGYDEQGHLASVTTAAGATTYSYGAFNRLQKVTDSQGGVTTYTYDVVGNLVSTRFANGITETRGYDALNRLVSVTNINSQSQTISSYVYTLDAVGNKLRVLESNGRKVDYIYDTRDRLLSEQITDAVSGNRTIAYTYDAVGNRLTLSDSVAGNTSYSYNENDWLISETRLGEQNQYSYDNNGSLLTKFHNANDQTTYNWNLDHRLAGVQITNGTGTHQSTYAYDADGNRVAQVVDGVNNNYLVDTNRGLAQVAAEYDSQGIKTSYTYAGNVISQTSNNTQSFYLNDGHSGVRLVTNTMGTVTDAYNYDGYGNLLSGSATGGDRYRGESRDVGTGLQYLRARYYDSSTGRFASVDPFEGILDSPISRHRYLYGNANPITYSDPTGNFAGSISEVGAVLSILEILSVGLATQISIGIIADRISGTINWKGTLSSISGKGEIFGADLSLGLSLLDLTTIEKERSSFLYPNSGKSLFRGKWLQILGGAGVTVPDLLKPIASANLSLNSKVVAFSPAIFQASPGAFAGAYFIASLASGPSSPKYFRAGFGWGGSTGAPSSSSINKVDAGLSLKEGISIPVSFFPEII
jgi:RHS repeat-associated protein